MNTRSRPYRCSIGHRPADQRQTGEPGERGSDAGELRQAGCGRDRAFGEVAEATVAQPHREDDRRTRLRRTTADGCR